MFWGAGWLQAFVLFMVLLHLIEAGASGLAVTGTGISVLVGTALVLTIIETSVSQLGLSFIEVSMKCTSHKQPPSVEGTLTLLHQAALWN